MFSWSYCMWRATTGNGECRVQEYVKGFLIRRTPKIILSSARCFSAWRLFLELPRCCATRSASWAPIGAPPTELASAVSDSWPLLVLRCGTLFLRAVARRGVLLGLKNQRSTWELLAARGRRGGARTCPRRRSIGLLKSVSSAAAHPQNAASH